MENKLLSGIYQPYIIKIPMLNSDILVRNVELLDNRTSEFPHTHNSYEIYYAVEGDLKIKVLTQLVNITAGNLLLLTPNTLHGTIYEPNVERKYFIMIFDIPENQPTNPGNSGSEFESLELQKIFTNVKSGRFHVILDKNNCHKIIEEISSEIRYKEFGWQSILRGLYLKFILSALRNIIPKASNDINAESQNINLAIEITKFMHENYKNNITLSDVAKAMYISPRHINRVFESCFHTTFSRTLSIFRLNYAKDYLYKTGYSIDKIANLVGFSSSRTLLKLFHDVEGISTTKYRKLIHSSKNK